MSDAPNGAPAPAPEQSPPATPPVAKPPAAPAQTLAADLPEDALSARLERARKLERDAVLAELGVDIDTAKAAVTAKQAAEAAAKGVEERLGEANKTLEQRTAELKRVAASNKEWATRQMMGLSEDKQQAVEQLVESLGHGKDDHAAILSAIAVLTPTWAPAASATPAAPAPAAPPSTAPARDAPGGTNLSPPDHAKIYEQMIATNPFAAAEYAAEHAGDIWPASKQ